MNNNTIKYDPLLFKFPQGVVKKGSKVKFFVQCDDESVQTIYLMWKSDVTDYYNEQEMKREKDGYKTSVQFEESGHFWYHFKIVKENETLFLNKSEDNYSFIANWKGEDFFQSVLEKEYTCTNSLQGGIIYQIFVDRFCKVGDVKTREPLIYREDWGGKIKQNTTDPLIINLEVFGGNFKGVVSKLDYLKELGITTIYLNPISYANSNHKYDTADYMTVDPMFGTERDFVNLIEEAKQRDINIIIDGVYNHTGSDSIYFNKEGRFPTLGAFRSPKSRFYSWYNFIDYPNVYESWWGIDTLPKLADPCPDFENYIAGDGGVIERFMRLGLAGVRLDVVDEFGDEFVKKIAKKVHEFGDNKVIMGEVWEDASTKISYSNRRTYFCQNELNSVMNYPYKESILNYIREKDSKDLNSTTRMLKNNYPKVVMDNLMNFLGTHDTGRVYSELKNIASGDEKLTQTYLKIASLLSFTLPGVPSIFYGDEYGMENNDDSSRGCFVEKDIKKPVLAWYKKLAKIRQHKVFKDGEMNVLYSDHGKFVFERIGEDEHVIVCVNLKKSPIEINFESKYKSLVSGKKAAKAIVSNMEFDIWLKKK